jgi:hypothetical protein
MLHGMVVAAIILMLAALWFQDPHSFIVWLKSPHPWLAGTLWVLAGLIVAVVVIEIRARAKYGPPDAVIERRRRWADLDRDRTNDLIRKVVMRAGAKEDVREGDE